MFCPSCGAENADHADFCAKCGAKIQRVDVENTPGSLAEQVSALCREVRSEKSLKHLLVGDEIDDKTREKILASLRKLGIGQPSTIWAFLPFVSGSKLIRVQSKKSGLLISEDGLFTVNSARQGAGFLSWADFSRTGSFEERKTAMALVFKHVKLGDASLNQLFNGCEEKIPLVPSASPLRLFVPVGIGADEPAVRGFVEKLHELVLATGIPAEGSRPSVGEMPNSWSLLGIGGAIAGVVSALIALGLLISRGFFAFFAGILVALLCFTPLVLSFRIKTYLKSGKIEGARRLSRIIRNLLLGAVVAFVVVGFVGEKVAPLFGGVSESAVKDTARDLSKQLVEKVNGKYKSFNNFKKIGPDEWTATVKYEIFGGFEREDGVRVRNNNGYITVEPDNK